MNNPTQNPPSTSVSDIDTESQLIELSMLIGSIAESNSHYTDGLIRFIEKLGKPLPDLTVSELITIIEEYRKAFNACPDSSADRLMDRVAVSQTKHQSLRKQHEIIGAALTIFEVSNTQESRLKAAQDTIELVRMLQEIQINNQKTSRFDVFNKAKKIVARRVRFNQAKQYQDCIVKFSCMEAA